MNYQAKGLKDPTNTFTHPELSLIYHNIMMVIVAGIPLPVIEQTNGG